MLLKKDRKRIRGIAEQNLMAAIETGQDSWLFSQRFGQTAIIKPQHS